MKEAVCLAVVFSRSVERAFVSLHCLVAVLALMQVTDSLLSLMSLQVIPIPLVSSQTPLENCDGISQRLLASYSCTSVVRVDVDVAAGSVSQVTLGHCLSHYVGVLNRATLD